MSGEAAPTRALPASPQLQEAPWTSRLTLRPHPHPHTLLPAPSLPTVSGRCALGGWVDVQRQGRARTLQPVRSGRGLGLKSRGAGSLLPEAQHPGAASCAALRQARRTKFGSRGAVRLAPFSRTCGWTRLPSISVAAQSLLYLGPPALSLSNDWRGRWGEPPAEGSREGGVGGQAAGSGRSSAAAPHLPRGGTIVPGLL